MYLGGAWRGGGGRAASGGERGGGDRRESQREGGMGRGRGGEEGREGGTGTGRLMWYLCVRASARELEMVMEAEGKVCWREGEEEGSRGATKERLQKLFVRNCCTTAGF